MLHHCPFKRSVILSYCSREVAISMSRDKSVHVIFFSTVRNVYTGYITAVIVAFDEVERKPIFVA